MKGCVSGEIGRRSKPAQVRTYLPHVVVRANDLPSLNPVEMGKWCAIPQPIRFALKLVVANHNTTNTRANNFADNFVPFRVGAVKLTLVVSEKIAPQMSACADMPIGQFPGALGMNKGRSWCQNPVVEQTNVEFLNKGRHGRANKPAEEDNEAFHGDWIWVNDKTISTQSKSTPVPRNGHRLLGGRKWPIKSPDRDISL